MRHAPPLVSGAVVEWRSRAAWAVLAVFGVARLGLAIFDQYPYFPDEIYQALEPAHRAAFGYGFRAWEFVDGARSYLVPGIFAGLFRLGAALGVTQGLWLVCLAKGVVVLLSLGGLWSAMAVAGRRAGPWGAVATGLVLGLWPLLFVTWHRTLSETMGASVALIALALVDRPGGRRAFLAGLVCGLGVFVRYQGGLFVLAFVLIPLLGRRYRDAALYTAGAALAGAIGGGLDWITWGRPFHSFITYVEFNLVQDGAVFFGVEPWSFYLDRLLSSTGPLVFLFALAALVGLARVPVIGVTAVGFTVLHSLTPHKELRFIIPALALAAIPTGLGLVWLARLAGRRLPLRARPVLGAVALAALAVALAPRAWLLSWDEVGILPPPARAKPSDPILLLNRDTNPALSWVGRRRDVCGVIVRGRAPIWTGGYVYLHRHIPLFFRDLGENRRMANYVIAPDEKEPIGQQYRRVGKIGSAIVYRRPGGCDVPEGYEPPIASDRPSVEQIEQAKQGR